MVWFKHSDYIVSLLLYNKCRTSTLLYKKTPPRLVCLDGASFSVLKVAYVGSSRRGVHRYVFVVLVDPLDVPFDIGFGETIYVHVYRAA